MRICLRAKQINRKTSPLEKGRSVGGTRQRESHLKGRKGSRTAATFALPGYSRNQMNVNQTKGHEPQRKPNPGYLCVTSLPSLHLGRLAAGERVERGVG